MVQPILAVDLQRRHLLSGYECEIGFVPLGLPYQEAPWHSDDRSITVDNCSGSLWFHIYAAESEDPIGFATFAADTKVVRCDGIEVDAAHRRQGIATAIYRLAACIFGAPVVPSPTLLNDGHLFWQHRASISC